MLSRTVQYFAKAFMGLLLFPAIASSQLNWEVCGSEFGPVPAAAAVYKFSGQYQGKPFRAFYAEVDIKTSKLTQRHDTSSNRRLTPAEFYAKNKQPWLVVNTSFFSFAENLNLNIVVDKGKILAFNQHSIPNRETDSSGYYHPFVSALGISKKREMDVAWTFTSNKKKVPFATQFLYSLYSDANPIFTLKSAKYASRLMGRHTMYPVPRLKKWKKNTVIGGGPGLVQGGTIYITNNEERKFAGNAIDDVHPRTAMGYTRDGKLIVLVIEGRNPGISMGATLTQTAEILVSLGCIEALNLDGGGSSCLLINGHETIRPSDKEGQRAIPAAFLLTPH